MNNLYKYTRTITKRNELRNFIKTILWILMSAAIALSSNINVTMAKLQLQQNPDSISAERASVYDPLTEKTLYEKTPESGIKWGAMGSTAKIMTIHVALEAVKAGIVSLDDMVTISDKAATQACNCFPGKLDGNWLEGGDKMTLDDALYSVALSHGEPTVALAEFIAKAVKSGSKEPSKSEEESKDLENYFISLMNDEVHKIGLLQTNFMTVHGGDKQGQYTTPEDLIQIWNYAVESNEKFLEYTGMRSHNTTVYTTAYGMPVTFDFELGKSYNYHPGVDGDKGGASKDCKSCLVSQATRIGRTLIEANLQSNAYTDSDGNYHAENYKDADKLFTRGFEALFLPEPLGQSAPWGAIKDHSLACISWHRAASAVITPQNQMKIITWDLDLNEDQIEELECKEAEFPLKQANVKKEPKINKNFSKLKSVKASRQSRNIFEIEDDGNKPSKFNPEIILTTSLPNEVDIIYVGGGYLVVAEGSDNGSLKLSSWGIPKDCPAFYIDSINVGFGTDIKLQKIKDGKLVSIHRSPDEDIILQSWSLDINTGRFDPGPLSKRTGPKAIEFDASGRGQVFLEAQLVTAIKTLDKNWELIGWTIYPQTGQINQRGSDKGGKGSILSVVHVPGFGKNDIYATALRRDKANKMKIIVYSFLPNGELQRMGEKNTNYKVSAQGIISIESYFEEGVLVAAREGKSSTETIMSIWSLDEKDDGKVDVNFVVEERSGPLNELIGFCRVPDNQAEGDFLFAHRNFFDYRLELEGWRSGER
jgi:D-alanyl-D-alanine carboxypeptidase